MTDYDVGLLVAQVVTMWSLGFCSGWILTKFNHAMNQTV